MKYSLHCVYGQCNADAGQLCTREVIKSSLLSVLNRCICYASCSTWLGAFIVRICRLFVVLCELRGSRVGRLMFVNDDTVLLCSGRLTVVCVIMLQGQTTLW